MHEIDLEKVQREESRWRILRALDAGRPQPVADTILFRCLHDIALPITPNQVRRELAYLEERGLVHVIGRGTSPTWLAELTRDGVDVVEYTVPCDAGIARPAKYW
jgi:Fe2+ or Zn2+ uptake regulation protein